MSVSNETNRISYTAAGGETNFNFTNILVFEASDLKVYKNGSLLSGSAYSVTLSGTAPSDGYITLNTAAVADDIVIIERDIPLTQPTVYNPGTAFPAKSHEKALDRRALSDSDLALEARYVPKFNRGKNANIDWAYLDLPSASDAQVPVFDPASKTVTWTDADVLNVEGGTPATVNFSTITGTLDISGADSRVADITLPYSGAVPLDLTERFQNWYTVKDFGAVGNDTADDSQAFIDCEAASGLGWVYVPSGTYKLSADVTLTNVVISTGAVIKPDGGTTLTITGGIVTGYSQIFSGSGSVKITKQRPIYTEWFGGTADGTTDNIAAFDKAVDACANNTCAIQLLNGTYAIGSTWNLDLEGCAVAGMGRANTIIAASFASGNDIEITSNNGNYIGDLAIQPSVTKTSGAAISVTAATENKNSEFIGLRILNAYTGFHFVKASNWLVHHCNIENPVNAGIIIDNDNTPTDSSGKIDSSLITKSTTVGTGIHHVAGGNIHIRSNLISGFARQYYLNPDSGVAANNIAIVGNTLKDGTRGIHLDRTVGTGNWSNVTISANNIRNMSTANIHIGGTVAGWLSNVNTTGNVISVASGAKGVLIDDQDGILTDSNVFNGISGTTVGVDNSAEVATDVHIGDDNLYNGLTTDFLPAPAATEPLLFTGSKTFDFASVAFEDEDNTTVTVEGAEPGMISLAQISTMNNLNALLVSYVSATDTVTVALHNISDVSAIDLASGTLTVYVFNPAGLI